MLIKIKLMVDCSTIRLTRQVLAGKIPLGLWRTIEGYVVRSPMSNNFTLKNIRELAVVEDDLTLQIKILGAVLRNTNEDYPAGLLDPDEHFDDGPEYFSAGSMAEMTLVLQNTYPAWWHHEGVLELLQSAKAIAAKDSDTEIDDMMEDFTFRQSEGSNRTRAELLDVVSRNGLWGYVNWAIEDSRNLSEEKPSDRHIKRIHDIWNQAESEDGY